MRRLASLLAISFILGLAAPALLAPPSAAAAAKKKGGKKRGKDARSNFRAGRAPAKKRHDPIKPPPPRPPEPPSGLFRSLLTPGREWRFEARLDGRPLEVAVVLRVASVSALGKTQLIELTTGVAGAPAAAPPADLAALPPRLLFALVETPKQHTLTDLGAPPTDAKTLLKELARRGPALTDPPSPRPDFWRAGAYRGAQERRVDFPAGTAPASCYRWGALVDGVLDGTDLCQDRDHGPVLLTRRQGGHVLELAQAAPDGQARIDLPGPPSER